MKLNQLQQKISKCIHTKTIILTQKKTLIITQNLNLIKYNLVNRIDKGNKELNS
jgi:hypothetical protein